MNCFYCKRKMEEAYNSELDIKFLTGKLKEQMKLVFCRYCDFGIIVPVLFNGQIEWKDRFDVSFSPIPEENKL